MKALAQARIAVPAAGLGLLIIPGFLPHSRQSNSRRRSEAGAYEVEQLHLADVALTAAIRSARACHTASC
jgi:hypothetical protein